MIAQVISLLGTILVLSAYALVTYRGVNPTALSVSLLNIFGSIALLIVALLLSNVGYAILNIAWLSIAYFSYTRKDRHGRSTATVRE